MLVLLGPVYFFSVCAHHAVMTRMSSPRASFLMLLAASAAAAASLSEARLLQSAVAPGRFNGPLFSRIRTPTRTSHRQPNSKASSATSAGFIYPAAAAVLFNNGLARGISTLSPGHHRHYRTANIMATPLPMETGAKTAAGHAKVTLDTLPFDNRAIRELPVDKETENFVREVSNACFSIVAPTPVVKPVLVAASTSALGLLGLDAKEEEREDVAEYFSGEFFFCIRNWPLIHAMLQFTRRFY